MTEQRKPRTWKAFEHFDSLFGHKNMTAEQAEFLGFSKEVFEVREVLPDEITELESVKNKLNKLYRIAVSFDRMNSGGLCGQGFTRFICLRCDIEQSHPNTNTPTICSFCHAEVKEEYTKESKE